MVGLDACGAFNDLDLRMISALCYIVGKRSAASGILLHTGFGFPRHMDIPMEGLVNVCQTSRSDARYLGR